MTIYSDLSILLTQSNFSRTLKRSGTFTGGPSGDRVVFYIFGHGPVSGLSEEGHILFCLKGPWELLCTGPVL